MMTKEEIGQIIKKARLNAGYTQSQVASKLGRPQQTIANWEVGRSQPDANTLFELFQILGADLNESFGFSSATKKSSSAAEAAPEDDVFQIFDYLNDALVSAGLIHDGEDITDKQAEVLLGICSILRATFDNK